VSIGNNHAFPRPASDFLDEHGDRLKHFEAERGMTYRQWLVGMALQGLLSNAGNQLDFELAAEEAIGHADSVLAQLEKTNP
jgi:hypothetical protein